MALGVKVGRRALAHGLLCRFDPHWIAFGPPLVVTAEQIDEMVAILDRSLGEVLGELEIDRAGVARELRWATVMRPMIPRVRAPVRLLMYLRFVRYLLWEFRWPLVIFTVAGAGRRADPPPVLRPRGACRSPAPAMPSS